MIVFLFFLATEALCGDSTVIPLIPPNVHFSDDPPAEALATTYGLPTLVTVWRVSMNSTPRIEVNPMALVLILTAGWMLCMGLGSLAFDGGAGPAARTLLPPRRHPAIWLLAYIAAVPILSLGALIHDIQSAGVRGLGSPTGPAMFPLVVLSLLLTGVPLVAIALAGRRIFDRRHVTRLRFNTNAPPKPEIEWPF